MIKIISTEETLPVRQQVLRNNKPLEDCKLDGDNREGTFHLGCFESDSLVGVITCIEAENNVFQVRGMAVLDEYQGRQIGRQLMEKAQELMILKNARIIWMNAREKAIPFYKKLGYSQEGSLFNIPEIGLHIKMTKNIG